jgi:amino acid adenylation domain-containing protein
MRITTNNKPLLNTNKKTIQQLFAEQVKLYPNNTALAFENSELSYRELNQKSNILAHLIRKRYLQKFSKELSPDTLIGLYVDRGLEMIIAMLAIIKAGGAYVPLNITYPKERIKYILQDTKLKIILTKSKYKKELPLMRNIMTIYVDNNNNFPQSSVFLKELPDINKPHNLAYIIYTSGSTGDPKGVLIIHQALTNFLSAMRTILGIDKIDKLLALTPFTFDISGLEFYLPLVCGACCVIANEQSVQYSQKIKEALSKYKITIMQATPATWQMLIDNDWHNNSNNFKILCGGEALNTKLANKLLPFGSAVWNLYGPTETTIWSTLYKIKKSLPKKYLLAPIGKPIDNTQVYVLNKSSEIVPKGAAGELYIGGYGLARGYLNQPELTKEKFIHDPFTKKQNSKLYKTGDIVRLLPDGNLEFLGRVDNQIKIRGIRIEPNEIESVLNKHVNINHSIVSTYEEDIQKQLIAYYSTNNKKDINPATLYAYLEKKLPRYMIPSAFIYINSWPLTKHGKIDRKQLPTYKNYYFSQNKKYDSPKNKEEKLLVDIWRQILRIDHISRNDNFFLLGGDSLSATRVISHIKHLVGIDCDVDLIFRKNTIASLATFLRNHSKNNAIPVIKKVHRSQKLLPSFAEHRLWFENQYEKSGQSAYNLFFAMQLIGTLNIRALKDSFNYLIKRHETLRTIFRNVNGEPEPIILPEFCIEIPIKYVVSDNLINELTTAIQQPFNLESGHLLRVTLFRLDKNHHVILITQHHIITDGWSIEIFLTELEKLYNAFVTKTNPNLPALQIQYIDFTYWQRNSLTTKSCNSQIRYWRNKLKNFSELNLPTDYPRAAVKTYAGKQKIFEINQDITKELKEIAHTNNASLFMVLLAAFNILLARYSSQKDITIGTAIANRNHPMLENILGFFVNKLILRNKILGNPCFIDFLTKIKKTCIEAYNNQDIPFDYLVDKLKIKRKANQNPIFNVVFVLQNANKKETLSLANLKTNIIDLPNYNVQTDLLFNVFEIDAKLKCNIEYRVDLYQDETINKMAQHFLILINAIIRNPSKCIYFLPLLTYQEYHQTLIDWNQTSKYFPNNITIHKVFEMQAENTPDNIAVVFQEKCLTYKELNAKSNQLAHYIRQKNMGLGDLIAIYLERGLDMIIAILGVLKAGGAYIPLDINYPKEYVENILNASCVASIITKNKLSSYLKYSSKLIRLDAEFKEIYNLLDINPKCINQPDDIAYIIYTSGSTGKPKGVMITHRSIVNLLYAQKEEFCINENSNVLQFASISFDASVSEINTALSSGASLYILSDEIKKDVNELFNFMLKHKISVATLPPFLLNIFPKKKLPCLKTLIVAGDVCDKQLLTFWAKGRKFINAYGPTEITVCATMRTCSPNDERVLIGKPIANTQAYVLDKYKQPVPIGITGELFIGGVGLAKGYFKEPKLTRFKFIKYSYDSPKLKPIRLYKTGDLVKQLPDGNLEFIGRIDNQVKINGVRVELEEIENCLTQHQLVQKAAILLRENDNKTQHLIAYIEPNPNKGQEEIIKYQSNWGIEQLEHWQEIFNKEIYRNTSLPTAGWNSSYTDNPIPAVEMREWVDHTVERILALKPKRILEIGCGTGLLLFPIAKHCEYYCATDFSSSVLSYIQKQLNNEINMDHVVLMARKADEFTERDQQAYDTIIINSVIQYFPNIEYLMKVITGALECIKPGGHIFIGDIRNLDYLEVFHSSLLLYKQQKHLTYEQWQTEVNRRVGQEIELLVATEFFYSVIKNNKKISHVDIQLKRGKFYNEMTCFRYDVIFHIKQQINYIPNLVWHNWQKKKLTLDNIKTQLDKSPKYLALRNVSNARLIHIIDTLANVSTTNTLQPLKNLRGEAKSAIDPESLYKLGDILSYHVNITWSKSKLLDCFDVIFYENLKSDEVISFYQRKEKVENKIERALSPYTNQPLHNIFKHKLTSQLRTYLHKKLPDYMRPSQFSLLDKLPMTLSGKIDKKALLKNIINTPTISCSSANELELYIANIFRKLLQSDIVNTNCNFFEMGMHSFMIIQACSLLNKQLHTELKPVDLFTYSTIRTLANFIAQSKAEDSLFNLVQDKIYRKKQRLASRRKRKYGDAGSK